MRSPSEIGKSIAAEIERVGHFQGVHNLSGSLWVTEAAPCCVVTAPSYPKVYEDASVVSERNAFLSALAVRIGVKLSDTGEGNGIVYLNSVEIQAWNDTSATADVLHTLRSL